MWRVVALLLLGVALVVSSAASVLAAGDRGSALAEEMVVNGYTTGDQGRPAVAVAPDGEFLVAWSDFGYSVVDGPDGSGVGVRGRLFASDGGPLGQERQVNAYTTGNQARPSIGVDAAGRFVVVWMDSDGLGGGRDGSAIGLFARWLASDGSPLGEDFSINMYTTGFQAIPDVAVDPDGGAFFVWESGDGLGSGPDGSGFAVRGRRFASDGIPIGGELAINAYTTGSQVLATVARRPAGDFVVCWNDAGRSLEQPGQDGSGTGVRARRFDAGGAPLGGEFQVNATTAGDQDAPVVAVDAKGAFVVAWVQDAYPRGSGERNADVWARRFGSEGGPLGGDFRVNAYTTGDQGAFGDVSLVGSPEGDFLVVWTDSSEDADGSASGLFGQRFLPDGRRHGLELAVNGYTTGHQGQPALAFTGPGELVAVWKDAGVPAGDGSDGSEGGIRGRRLSFLLFSDGFESGEPDLWSAIVPGMGFF